MAESSVQPQTDATAVVNAPPAVPPGYVALYDADGREMLVRADEAPALERRLGLSRQRYDLEAAANEYVAARDQDEQAVAQFLADARQFNHIRPAAYDVLNLAMGRFIDARRALVDAIGHSLPTEAQVAALAAAVAEHGSQLTPDRWPLVHAEVTKHAAAIAAIDPATVAAYEERAAADRAQQQAEDQQLAADRQAWNAELARQRAAHPELALDDILQRPKLHALTEAAIATATPAVPVPEAMPDIPGPPPLPESPTR